MTPTKPPERWSDDELLGELRLAIAALPDVPATLQRAALKLWPVAGAKAGAKAGTGLAAHAGALLTQARRLVAELAFDSWAQPMLAHGMRSARAPTRHLLFSAEGRDVDLRVIPNAASYSIAGQILGPDDAGSIELVAELGADLAADLEADLATDRARSGAALTAQLDALGEFRIDSVPPGRYVMTLRLAAGDIVLPAVNVGEP